MRRILKGLGIVLLVIILLLAAAVAYVWQHQELLTDEVRAWYDNRYAGELHLGEVRLNSWREWPFLRLEVDDIRLRDTTWRGEDSTTLVIGRLTAEISLRNLLRRRLYLEKITLTDGHLRLLTAADGMTNTGVFRELHPDDTPEDDTKSGFLQLEQRPLRVAAYNFELLLDKELPDKHKRMAGCVHALDAEIMVTDTIVTAAVLTDASLEGLGFNLEKGYYLGDKAIRADFDLSFDRRDYTLEVPRFPFQVENQTFLAEICMDRSAGGEYHISLANDTTDFAATVELLPAELQAKLRRYQVKRPLATNIMLRGEFVPDHNVWVQVGFTVSDNEVRVDGNVFYGVRGRGRFANRLSTDPAEAQREDRKNLSLQLTDTRGGYKGAALHFPEAAFYATREEPHRFDFVLNASGASDNLGPILANENFFFRGGDFFAHLEVNSTEERLDRMLKTADGRLRLENTQVEYRPAGVSLPLTEMEVLLSPTAARVPTIRIPVDDDQEIHISGVVDNFGSLIFTDEKAPVRSDLHVYSEDLDFDNFMRLVAELQTTEEVADTHRTRLGETVRGIYQTFNPSLSLRLDRFAYQGIQARDVSTRLAFLDDANILLDSTLIRTGDSELRLRGTFRVPDRDYGSRMKMDLAIKAAGNTHDFNDAFANDTFLFEDGDYQFQGRLRGDVTDWRELMHAAYGRLHVQNTSVYFVPERLRFPVRTIELEVAQQDVILEEMTLGFPSGGRLHLAGRVDNFMDILGGVENPLIRSVLGLEATYLDYADFSGLFSSLRADDIPVTRAEFTEAVALADSIVTYEPPPAELDLVAGESGTNRMKRSLRELYHKFYPELAVRIDSFRHEETLVTDIRTDVSFQGGDVVQFADLGFTYRERPVRMRATLGLLDQARTPVDLELTTSRFDLGALVETYDYFGLPALQSADRISGKVSLQANLRGEIVDSVGLDYRSLMGAVHFTLHEAELLNFEPIQKIANKFFRKERFERIRFAPITDTLYIMQEVVHIPRMEVQSTAFNLFVEGHLNYDNNTNIWVSVPLNNFTSWEEGLVPLRRGYYASGAKVFVEARGNEEGGMDYKFRLRKKKWYLHQGIPSLYRQDRKYEQRMRKKFRRERRRAKRMLRRA